MPIPPHRFTKQFHASLREVKPRNRQCMSFHSLHKGRKSFLSFRGQETLTWLALFSRCQPASTPGCHTVTTRCGFPAGSVGKWWAGVTEPLQRPCRTPSFFMPDDILWIGRGTQARYGLIKSVSGMGKTAEEVEGHTQAHWSPGFIKPHCLWNMLTGNSAKQTALFPTQDLNTATHTPY